MMNGSMSRLVFLNPMYPDQVLCYVPMENLTMLNERNNQLDSTSSHNREKEFWMEAQKRVTKSPLEEQVGGSHYKTMKIQPVEFILANNLDFCQGNIIKYTCRYKQKGGVEDLHKVIHYARLLIEQIEKEKKE